MADKTDFADTPEGWASRWKMELDYADKKISPWVDKGTEVVKTFLDQRPSIDVPSTRLNLFHSNIVTLKSMLYGNIPKVDVERRYADADDDVARVACEMTTRMLNLDVEEAGEDYSSTMRSVLEDRLLPGLGAARLRYDFESEMEEQEEITHPVTGETLQPASQNEVLKDEWVDTCYVPWKDLKWSPCRFWTEMRWLAFRSYMDKKEVAQRFGEDVAKALPMNAKSPLEHANGGKSDVWSKAEIWEIWNKGDRKVYWYSPGYSKVLDIKEDPLEIEEFWPMPPPLCANLTTSEYMPVSDYVISQDLYKAIDTLQERIQNLIQACKVVGLYDKTQTDKLSQLLKPGTENQMIPVDNWAMFAEKNGIKGAIDFLPLEMVVNTLDKLVEMQSRKIDQLYQITGLADIIRGAGDPDSSATQDQLKAKFGSIRIQALQDEFARFATDMQKIKFELIAKHFDPETIMKASNIMSSPDAATPDLIQKAIQLIKSPEVSKWKIEIRPETLAMTDYAQIRQERSEYINALGLFMQSAAPITQQAPTAAPILMELLKWGLAGFKGSNQIEGVIDRAIAAMNQAQQQAQANPQPTPPNPKVEEHQAKAQAEQQAMQMKAQSDQGKAQIDMQAQAQKHQQNLETIATQHQLKMSEMVQNFKTEMARIVAQTNSDITVQNKSKEVQQHKQDHEIAMHEARTGEVESP